MMPANVSQVYLNHSIKNIQVLSLCNFVSVIYGKVTIVHYNS